MSRRVLLCDDEIHILRAAEFKLRQAGFDVRLAHDGQAAWEAIQNEPPDMLVTDLQMPRMDGLELIRKVRAAEPFAQLPIIMLTAKGYELNKRELIEEAGLTGLLVKPFSPRELLRAVEQALACA